MNSLRPRLLQQKRYLHFVERTHRHHTNTGESNSICWCSFYTHTHTPSHVHTPGVSRTNHRHDTSSTKQGPAA
jgi:hypothetical protein